MKHLLKDVLKTDYSLLVHCPFIKQADLRVIVGKEYGCKAIEHTKLLSVINNEWNFMLQQRPYLFNQSKYRYHHGNFDGVCSMYLGLTDYKSYVGSNLGREWRLFREEGLKQGHPDDYFANPLGNQCVVVLNDHSHVVVNRSYQVAEGEGKLTCLGGHPEPLDLGIVTYEDASKVSSESYAQKLFESIDREVVEESNIPQEAIVDTRMIGVVASHATHGREVQMFCCFVNLSQEEVRKYYSLGPEDQYESVGINFFTLDTIVDIMNTTPERFVPEARGLYTLLVDQEEEYEKILQSVFHQYSICST